MQSTRREHQDRLSQELRTLTLALSRVLAVFERIPVGGFVIALCALVVVRSGVDCQDDFAHLMLCIESFPEPGAGFRCQNVAIIALPVLLGVDSEQEFLLLHTTLTACTLLLTLVLAARRCKARFREAALWLSVSAMPACLLQTRVHYDVYTVLAGSLLGLAQGPSSALAGGVLLGLVHPEQALLGGLSYGLVAVGLGGAKRSPAAREYFGLGGILLGVGLSKLYLVMHPPTGPGRGELLAQSIAQSLWRAAQAGTLGIYAWYGLSWLLVLAWLGCARASRRERGLVALGLVALPACASLITLDGTRVFMGTVWPAFSYFVARSFDREEQGERRVPIAAATSLALVLALVTPQVVSLGKGFSSPKLGSLFRSLWQLLVA